MSLARWFWVFLKKTCFLAWKNQKTIVTSFFRCIFDRQNISWYDCWIFSNLSNSRFRSLIGWIQAITLRKREFDRLEKIQQSYQLISCLRKSNGRTQLRSFFGFFTRQKQLFFQKHSKSARQTHFFQKMTKIFYLMADFFNKFY